MKTYKWESSSITIKSSSEELIKHSLLNGYTVSIKISKQCYNQTVFKWIKEDSRYAIILDNSSNFNTIMGYLHQLGFGADCESERYYGIAIVIITNKKLGRKESCAIQINKKNPDKEINVIHKGADFIFDWAEKTNFGQKEI